MSILKEKLRIKIVEQRKRTKKLYDEYGDVVIDQVTIKQVIGGMRGIQCLVSDTSSLDPYEGIKYRGYTLSEIFEKLPKPQGAEMPYVEGVFYLLLTGDIPTQNDIESVLEDFSYRRIIPRYIIDLINSFPNDSHPMTIFSSVILSMHRESLFTRKYNIGINKFNYWDPMYEDSLNLIAKLPEIAAQIYAKLYTKETVPHSSPEMDLAANFAYMMGKEKPYDDVIRMHFIIHADHESGNVSAHTGHLVASSLSDVYLSISAMINGLAGPLHGLAAQNVLKWLQDMVKQLGSKEPDEKKIRQYVWDSLNAGQVIPGYGHAVLRKTDPRYSMQREFSLKHLADDTLFKYTDVLYKVVPEVLKEHGHANNPWPNVDAHSGIIQWHYGLHEYNFYTVLFGLARSIGICANLIWDRALLYPLERPKSITTNMLEDIAFGNKKGR